MDTKSNIEKFIAKHKEWEKILSALRSILQETEMEETIKWGVPTYTVNHKNIVAIGAFKNYCGLWFFQGALLNDTYNVLINAQEGTTKAQRQWRFHDIKEINKKHILDYVGQAIQNQLKGKEIKPEKKNTLNIPESLAEALNSNQALNASFNALTPFKQREFADFIHNAKREETKIKRLNKSIPLILEGKGLHDKYRK